MQTLDILGKKWAVNFWWQPLTSAPRKQVREINKETVAEEGQYDALVILKKHKQIGIGRRDNKEDVGLPSLAGTLARVFGLNTNILGYFQFDDGSVWVFALKDGHILPGGDFYGPEEEGREFYQRFSQSDIWNQVFETENSQESEEKIKECLGALERNIPRVQALSYGFYFSRFIIVAKGNPKKTVLYATIAVILIGSGVGYFKYQAYKMEKARQEELMRQRKALEELQKKQKKTSIKKLTKEYFPRKWEDSPVPALPIHSCYMKQQDLLYIKRGWIFDSIICDSETTRIIRDRQDWASFISLPEGSEFQMQEPNKSIQTIENNFSKRPNTSELWKKEKISANIYELARYIKTPVKISWKKPEPEIVPEKTRQGTNLPKKILCPYWIGEFELKEIQDGVTLLGRELNKFPGVVISEIKKEDTWNVKGVLYAK